MDRTVTVRDLANGDRVSHFSFTDMPIHFKFSPGGERFAIVSVITGRETLSVYDITNGVPQWSNVFDRHISALNWHPSGRWIAACHMAGSIALIDARTGEMRPLGQHTAEAVTVIFSPDGRYLFSGGWERELICWDLQTMQRAFTIGLDSFEMQFRIDGRECAINSRSGLQLYAVETPAQREFPEELGSRLRRAEFSPDGRWLAASGEKQGAVWDLPDGGPGALVEEAAETHLYFTPQRERDVRQFWLSLANYSNHQCGRAAPSGAATPLQAGRVHLTLLDFQCGRVDQFQWRSTFGAAGYRSRRRQLGTHHTGAQSRIAR
jgi:WD40 repeat protein